MYNLLITNQTNGFSLDFNNPSSPFIISEILGLDPPDATVNIDEYAVLDGGIFNSAKANYRTLQIAFAIDYDAANSRQKIYRVLQPGRPVRIDYSDDNGLKVYTIGYAGKPEITHFAMKQVCTVTISCPDSYWQGAEQIAAAFYSITNAFSFPFGSVEDPGDVIFGTKNLFNETEIVNDGNLPIGFVVDLLFKDATSTGVTITNIDTGAEINITWVLTIVQALDIVRIDTRPNHRKVVLIRNGVEVSSLFNGIDYENLREWPMLNFGTNTIKVAATVTGEAPDISLTEQLLYEGV